MVLLDDPDAFLFVHSGALDVFVILDHEDRGRHRRYLLTAYGGEAIFPLVAGDAVPRITTVAVALTDVQLSERRTSALDTHSDSRSSVPLLTQWAGRLHTSLRDHDVVARESVPSVQHALVDLHASVVARLRADDDEEHEHRREIAAARRQLTQETTRRVLRDLASAAGSNVNAIPADSAPLLAAVRAVANTQAIRIVSPRGQLAGDFDRDLDAIRRASRVRTRRVLLTGLWWTEDAGPLLGRDVNDGRPLALVPRGASRYELFDPADGSRVTVTADVARRIAPSAHMFYRPLPDGIAGPIDLVRFSLKGRRRDLATAGVAALAVTLLAMLAPIVMAVVVNDAIPDANRALLLQIAVVLVTASVARALFEITENVAMLRIETGSTVSAQAAMWDRLLNLKLSEIRQYSAGDLQARMGAIEAMRQKLGAGTIRTLLTSSLALLNLVLMFYYSVSLAIVALLIGIVAAAVTLACGRQTLRKLQPLLRMRGEILGFVVQLVQGIGKLRVAGAEERAFTRWAARYHEQQAITRDLRVIGDRLNAFNQVLPTLAAAMLFAVAGRSLVAGEPGSPPSITLGIFLAFNIAFATFIAAAATMSSTVVETLDAIQLWTRARPILEAEIEDDAGKTAPGPLRGDIALEHVTFHYREDGPLILDDVSLHARAGEFIALVGPSGSGKSTIFRLLLGFEAPQSGALYFDGQDLAGLADQEVRRQLGVVLQNSRILAASIFENISASANVSLTDAWEAARGAGFAEDVESFPMQMHTYISEGGTNLSGGQRQRLLIARALGRKPPILLLDEATSALDNRTQAKVSRSLERLGVTRIVIAHRLSTIEKADRIYVIDAGRIVQQGTFSELIAQQGLFARLASRQRV